MTDKQRNTIMLMMQDMERLGATEREFVFAGRVLPTTAVNKLNHNGFMVLNVSKLNTIVGKYLIVKIMKE